MITLTQIKKRNGDIVAFDAVKIHTAIQKAFIAVRGGVNESILNEISDRVNTLIERNFTLTEIIPSVENVQDIVERTIMEFGFFDVAKAYIIYRYKRTEVRAEKKRETLEKVEKGEIQVTKRDGSKQQFSLEKIKRAIAHAARGYESVVDINEIARQTRTELYEDISTKDIAKALVMVTRAMIEREPAYSKVAARLLLNSNYKEVIGQHIDYSRLSEAYRAAFIASIKRGVEIQKYDPRLLDFDLQALAQHIVVERDDELTYLGAQTLYDRYFTQELLSRRRLETPQILWMRVAMGLAIEEKEKTKWATEFYDIISTLQYMPSTPTLFHAGTLHPQLSSCYLNTVADSLDHIFKVYADNAQLSKWSGGIGTDWTSVRATGSPIKGTGVESQGVIPFLKIANDVTVAINRSGRRRGASCVYLESWHADIEDFLELRKNTGDERRRTHDMDTANWIPDLFMKRVKSDAEWSLFSPNEVPDLHELFGAAFEKRYEEYEALGREGKLQMYRTVSARDLWKKMINMLFETGHPWITWKDPSNVRSPQDHVGVIHNSNLCTEITLNTSKEETAVCNLGSVNLSRHITNGELDINRIRRTVTTAMRLLDNVIDINFYPTIEAKQSNLRHRPVGLGVMGFHDALYQMDIMFDSEECVEFADRCQEAIAYYAYHASSLLAAERGAYQSFKGSKWDRGILPQDTIALLERERGMEINIPKNEHMDWSVVRESIKRHGMRNSNCLAIAPTATISNISGCVPSIEPIYTNIYVKSNVSGDFIVINTYLVEDLKKLKLWDDEMLGKIKFANGSIQGIAEIPEYIRNKYKEVFEIESQWLIKAAAHRGRWIDQSQSLNIFYGGTSGKEISDIYMYAWELGLKTTYYLRTLAASGVEKSTVNTTEFGSTHVRKQEEVIAVTQIEGAAPVIEVQEQTTVIVEPQVVVAQPKLCKINDPSCESCQ